MKKIILSAVFLCSAAFAQTGFPPFGSFDEGTNRANLNTNVSIPITSVSGRGMGMSLALVNDSIHWTLNASATAWTPSVDLNGTATFGWKATSPFGHVDRRYRTLNCRDGGINEPVPTWDTYVYIDGMGTKHAFNVSVSDHSSGTGICAGGISGTFTGYATDNSGYYIDITDPNEDNPTIYSPSGMKMVGLGDINQITDTNGNYATRSVASNVTTWYDTINRAAVTITDTKSTNNKVTYSILSNSGTNATVEVTYANTNIKTNFACTGKSEYTGTGWLPTQIQFVPGDGHQQTYAITYEATPSNSGYYTGRIATLTLPTGGVYKYQYYDVSSPNPSVDHGGVNCSDGTFVYLKRIVNDGSDHTWIFSRDTTNRITTVTPPSIAPDTGAHQKYTFDTSWRETKEQFFQDSGETVTMRTVDTAWAVNGTPSSVTTTLDNNKKSQVTTNYNSYNLLTSKSEYDFGSGAVGTLLRTTTYTYLSSSGYTARNILNRVTLVQVFDGLGTQVAQTTNAYDGSTPTLQSGAAHHDDTNYGTAFNTRGNLTSVTQWSNGATDPVTTYTYYTTGMVKSVQDPGTHTTSFDYTDNFTDAPAVHSAYAFVKTVTNPASQTVTSKYYWPSGALYQTTDPNSQTTTYTYDILLRAASVSYPDGGQISTTYTESSNQVQVQTLLSTGVYKSVYSKVDSLGRAARTATYNGTNYEQQDTCFDEQGRVSFVSAPYQDVGFGATSKCAGTLTDGTQNTYDGLGRTLSVTAKATGLTDRTATTDYRGASVRSIDAGNGTTTLKKVSQFDGLGRLNWICEVSATNQQGTNNVPSACGSDLSADVNGFLTTYTYDTVDHLTQVSQAGLKNRYYQYNALGRLTRVAIPEEGSSTDNTGPTTFTYTTEGLLATRTRPAPNQTNPTVTVTTTYTFDNLHRPTQTSYSDGTTPTATYTYDLASDAGVNFTNYVGRLGRATVGHAQDWFSYDAMGRVSSNWQMVPPQYATTSFQFQYTYDKAGDVLTANSSYYIMTYTYDVLQRLNTATSSWSNIIHPATMYSNPSFGRFGIGSYTVGASINNGVQTVLSYTNFGELASKSATDNGGIGTTRFSMGSMSYAPNGMLTGATVNSNGWTHTYDDLGRILTSSGSTVSYSFDYDRYGNRAHQTVTTGTGNNVPTPADGLTNRVASGNGISYDALGNITNDGSHSYTFDAENRIIQVDGGTTATYLYDAFNRRVQKTTSTGTLNYTYDLGNNVNVVYSGTSTPLSFARAEVFLGSSHLATYTASHTYFHHQSSLGSRATTTDETGAKVQDCEWYPFGDLKACTTNTDQYAYTPYGYADYERDGETGLDHMQFRYYNSRIGRFMGADLLGGSGGDPQSLNKLGYTSNNPTNAVDSLGLEPSLPPLNNPSFCSPVYEYCSAPDGGPAYALGTTQISEGLGRLLLGSGFGAQCNGCENIPVRNSHGNIIGYGSITLGANGSFVFGADDRAMGYLMEYFDCTTSACVNNALASGQSLTRQTDQMIDLVNNNPSCGAMFGGTRRAVSALRSQVLINIDTPGVIVPAPGQVEATGFIRDAESAMPTPFGAVGRTTIGTPFTYVSNRFFSQPAGLQMTLRFHELTHNLGRGPEPNGFQYGPEMNQITAVCHTGAPQAQ